MQANTDLFESDFKEVNFSDEKYYTSIEYRGYTLMFEFNSEGVFYNFQNFENDVLKRAIRFISGGALYMMVPVLGFLEMASAVISDVFVKEGYELAIKLKKTQMKLYSIDNKIDSTVLSRGASSIRLGLNGLHEYHISRNIDDFKDFYMNTYQGLDEISSFLMEKTPLPSFMNSVATLTKLIEDSITTLKDMSMNSKEIEFKYESITKLIDHAKCLLARQWELCLKYYESQINYGKKKIKSFFKRQTEHYVEDKMHGIVIKITYRTPWFCNPQEEPLDVLKKYIEKIHKGSYIIKECSLTYLYVRDKIDQTKYPYEKFCFSFEQNESEEMKEIMLKGKLIEDTNQTQNLFPIIQGLFDGEISDISWVAKEYLRQIGHKWVSKELYAWRSIDHDENLPENAKYKEDLALFKSKVTREIIEKFDRIIELIIEEGLPKAETVESKMFFLTFIGTYHVAKLEVVDERRLKGVTQLISDAFEAAIIVSENLEKCDSARLQLANEYANFLINCKYPRSKILKIVNDALLGAEEDIDDLSPMQKQETVLLITELKKKRKLVKKKLNK